MPPSLKTPKELSSEDLKLTIDSSRLPFESTRELKPVAATFGQRRAIKALDLGIGIDAKGFNIFLAGEPGTGKTSMIVNMLRDKAKNFPVPDDWCYCYNFDQPDAPIAFPFPAGKGGKFKKDMAEILAALKKGVPKIRESEIYMQQRSALDHSFRERENKLFYKLKKKAKTQDLDLDIVDGELSIQIVENGEPLEMEKLEALPDKERSQYERRILDFHDEIDEYIHEQRKLEKEKEDRLEKLETTSILSVCQDLLIRLRERYSGLPGMDEYIRRIEQELPKRFLSYFERSERKPEMDMLGLMDSGSLSQEELLLPFDVNLLIDNCRQKGAPVIIEANPNYHNLLGQVEYREQAGWLSTDHTQIKPGALHMANGGFLVIQAADLLRNGYSWDALKRALRTKALMIQEPNGDPRGRILKSLDPQGIPLNIKVVLVGSYYTYYWLWEMDEDFSRLFKIKADFESTMPISEANVLKYARFIAKVAQEEDRLPLSREGFARLIEYSSRQAGHQRKLSVKLSHIIDLYMESDFWARQGRAELIEAFHIDRVVRERIIRHGQVQESFENDIKEGELLIQTRGREVGQINGIAVYEMGDYRFAVPSRITAQAYAGRAGIINIDRESDLTGPIHNKAILILQGMLGGMFAHERPLSLSVSITFEQTYGIVEGDSATIAELYALLSAAAGVPINQGIAVTGSLNQKGYVQPIGAVNEKIEGHYRVCKTQGLTGRQGVVIPKQNVKHLNLSQDLVEAVKAGKFHIYPIGRFEEAIPLIMEVPAGQWRRSGWGPADSLMAMVDRRLNHFHTMLESGGTNDEAEE